MASQIRRSTGTPVALQIVKAIIVFSVGGIVVHLVVMFIDYFLMVKPLFMDLQTNFAGSVFSMLMFPMIMAYGLFSLSVYLLWEKKKKAFLLARDANLQREKVDAVLKSMQGLTGLLVEHIAIQNSEVLNYIELRSKKGQTVSEKIEKPSKKIASALQALSETSFIVPFTDSRPEDIAEIVDILKGKLNRVNTSLRCRPPSDRHLR